MNSLRIAAQELRDKGYSYSMINKSLGVSKSTMSYWFSGQPFSPNKEAVNKRLYGPLLSGARRHNQKVKDIATMKALGVREVGTLSTRDIWMVGIGLYLGEGAKTVETIRIANSDPAIIITAIRWLRDACKLSNDNITIRLHLYPDNDAEAALQYWHQATGLPKSNFRKSHIDTRQNKKTSARGKLPHGTAHLTVVCKGVPENGVKLYRRMNGWIAGVLNQM